MHLTARLLAPGLAQRSLDEAKRWAKFALSGDAVRGRYDPMLLVDFSNPDTIKDCKTMSDAELGGYSTAMLQYVPKSATEPAHARFHGSISTDLPRDNPQVHSTGFAGWRNQDRPWTIFGKPLWDLSPYPFLALRIKSDERKYFVNIQTESVVPSDLHQHRLHTRKPGEWETVFLEFRSFVRTNHGHVVEPQNEMLKHKTRSVGLSSIDRVRGPFDISIHKIWAALKIEEGDILEDEKHDQRPRSSIS